MPPLVATLMYHEVADDPSRSGFQRPAALRYGHSRAAFARHLDHIRAAGARPRLVTDTDLAQSGRHVMLTFDDGGRSAVDAAEELEQRGWRGHFFVVTSLIGAATFLQPRDLRRLRQAGHVVGTHSHTHPDIFPDLPPRRMLDEWLVSRRVLEDLLGEPCLTASLPGGDLSPAVLDTAAAAGLHHLFTSEPRLEPARHLGCWVLGRVCIKRAVPVERVANLVRGKGWVRERAVRELKVALRKTLAPLYRAYVRRAVRADLVLTARG